MANISCVTHHPLKSVIFVFSFVGFLSSDTDVGTYDATNIDGEKNFIEADTFYTSMGGETVSFTTKSLMHVLQLILNHD